MNIKIKLVAVIIILFSFAMPFAVSASTGNEGGALGLLASIGSIFQQGFSAFYSALTKNLVSSSTTPTSPSTVSHRIVAKNSITLKLGDKSVIVAVLQRFLISEGYLKPPTTGIFDASTQAAVEAFQKAKNLPVTGYVMIASSSIASSFAAAAPVFSNIEVGATGTRAAAFQKFLIKKGALNGSTTTGYFGATTAAGVKAFQKSQGLPQTGVIDRATFAAMNKE